MKRGNFDVNRRNYTRLKDLEINEKIISLAYMRASAIARFCVTNYGARTHLEELTKIKSYQECICGNITVE